MCLLRFSVGVDKVVHRNRCQPVCVCVFITAVPITKLFAWGGGGLMDLLRLVRLLLLDDARRQLG
jgi:hypothetical protein